VKRSATTRSAASAVPARSGAFRHYPSNLVQRIRSSSGRRSSASRSTRLPSARPRRRADRRSSRIATTGWRRSSTRSPTWSHAARPQAPRRRCEHTDAVGRARSFAAWRCKTEASRLGQARGSRAGVTALRGLACCCSSRQREKAHARLALAFPGPVVGLVLLLFALRWSWIRERPPPRRSCCWPICRCCSCRSGSRITHLDLVSATDRSCSRIGSRLIGMAVTALVLRGLCATRRRGSERRC